jgi:cyclohexyl-isocyanide hydratase
VQFPEVIAMSLQIGLVLFPKVTQLDFTGPLQVFAGVPGAKIHLIWKRIEPVPSDSVMMLTPTTTFAACPQLDVICVPGGAGTNDMVNDEEVLAFLRKQAVAAKFVTSVCTGSLVLGAAGLLKGIARRHTGPRSTICRPMARSRRRHGCVPTATASPAAASPPASISR